MSRVFQILAQCKNPECREVFPVAPPGEEGSASGFETEEHAVEKLRDWVERRVTRAEKNIRKIVHETILRGSVHSPRPARTRHLFRLEKCPSCGRTYHYAATDLFVEAK